MKSKVKNIAVFIPYIHDMYHKNILFGIQQAACKNNINLLIYSGESLNMPDKLQFNIIYDMINLNKIDGLIICNMIFSSFINEEEYFNFCNKFKSIPILNMGKHYKGIPSIVSDNYNGMLNLTTHFIEEHDCKNIVFIHGTNNNEDAKIRFNAYKDALLKHNIIFNPELVIYSNFFDEMTIAETRNFLNKKIPFDSIIASSDIMANAAYKVLIENNLKVPEDILLAGFDNIESSKYSNPPLTTVSQQQIEQGKISIEKLIEIINGKNVIEKIVINAIPIIRQSCGCNNIIMNNKAAINDNKKHSISKVSINHSFYNTNELTYIKNKLYELYLSDIQSESISNFFLNELKNILKNKYNNNDLSLWKDIITEINLELSDKVHKDPLKKVKHEYIFKLAMSTITSFENNIYQNLGVELLSLTKSMNYYMSQINATMDMKKLKDVLYISLEKLNINSCFISLYSPQNKKHELSKLYFASKNNKIIKLDKEYIFPSENLVPDDIDLFDERKSYIIFPLVFNDNNFGFILLEYCIDEFCVYESLRSNISTALKGAALINAEIKAKQKIAKLSQQKTDFFVNFAHETKTPLTIITNYLNKFIKQNGTSEELNIIKGNIDKLNKDMINFIDLEKIKRGQIFYNHNKIINLSNIVNYKSKIFSIITKNNNILIDTDIENDIYIKMDSYAIDRILNNLIDNAIKYTNDNGKIEIILLKKNQIVELHVKDTGIGISKQKLKHIFKPYHQITHEKRNIQGIGMGLYIVKKIVNEINADIFVESEINEGSTFKIFFKNYELKNNDKIENDIIYTHYNINNTKIKLLKEYYNIEKDTILLIEDNVELLAYLQSELSNNFNIYYAINGKAALQKLKDIPKPNLIISDIMMDVLDGFKFYDIISNIQNFKDIPFIFLTAINSMEEKIIGLKKGAVDFISKPFIIEELKAKILSILKIQNAQKESNTIEFENKLSDFLRKKSVNNNNFIFNNKYENLGISNREKEVIKLLINGYEYKEIGVELNISLNTVRSHISKIYNKCGVQNRVELINILH